MLTTEAPFYLSFNYSKDSSRCWFKANAMDVNKLKSLMKTKANKAGLDKTDDGSPQLQWKTLPLTAFFSKYY